MNKVFAFGELLLRLQPTLNREWIRTHEMIVHVGGAELNVAGALSNWNMPVRYGTALPDHYLSREIIDSLEEKNIDTSAIHFSGNRIGTYYLPLGAELKSAGVIYDRAGSSFGELKPGMIDWYKVLEGCDWFHFSAISPALNETAAMVCREALKVASEKGLRISVDLNYRAKLWQYGIAPCDIMPELVNYCDVIMGNIWSAEILLGLQPTLPGSDGKTQEELITGATQSMDQLHERFPRAKTLAYTFRLQKEYFAVLKHQNESVVSQTYEVRDVKDKAGSGDCVMGGIIFGLRNNHSLQQTVDFAAAAAIGKLQEEGDTSRQTIEMVHEKMRTHVKS
ncbi:MAG: sugar kinase [Chitinophagaceae bacterium]|nr:MAG: sugar kinase [Chitinophagaceae bacterium]